MALDDERRRTIVKTIRSYIARERISREEFARRTKLGKSTVDKLVVGIFSEKTLLQVESQLKISFSETTVLDVAADDYGRYPRSDVRNYEGDYLFVRPSFHDDGFIHSFAMQIIWSDTERVLIVRERPIENKKVVQLGKIFIPRASMHIFVMSNEDGWLKSLILSQLDVYRKMHGLMLTMGHVYGNLYTPVTMPVTMAKVDKIDPKAIGKLGPDAPAYQQLHQDLMAVETERYAKWIAPKHVPPGK